MGLLPPKIGLVGRVTAPMVRLMAHTWVRAVVSQRFKTSFVFRTHVMICEL